jgi:hypothetical protein
MDSRLDILRSHDLLDAGVLAVGLERGWVSRADVTAYAWAMLSAGDDRQEVLDLADAEELDLERVLELLRRCARHESLSPVATERAMRCWMFAALKAISEGGASPEAQLDRLEDAYATLGYPAEMQACSRYYVPPSDRARGIRVGEQTTSPLEAMHRLLAQLGHDLGLE